MKKIVSMLNYSPSVGEVNNEPSMTVPDQAMSIQEMLERFARGLPVGGARAAFYDEENDLPDLRTLDLEERAQLAMSYQDELRELRKGVQSPPPSPLPSPTDTPPPPPYTTAPPENPKP